MNKLKKVVIVSGARTAIGNYGGALEDVPAVTLGSITITEALKKACLRPVPDEKLLKYLPDRLKNHEVAELKKYYQFESAHKPVHVDQVIMGNVLQGGQGLNPARQSAIYSVVPKETPAFTVNKACASGLHAIVLGMQAIQLGEADIIIAGGMESMSHAPYILPNARWGYGLKINAWGKLIDLMVYDGLWEMFYGNHIGITAENIAERFKVSRKEQDQFALLSHNRARKAIVDGVFDKEIVPVPIQKKKGQRSLLSIDERPRKTSLEKLALLPPVFKKNGTVTAGNASGINDGAAAVILMSEDAAKEIKVEPWVTIKSYASCGLDPAFMGVGPVPAIRMLLDKLDLDLDDVDIIELNEAFAAQFIACKRELDLNLEDTNIHGGSLALGHPIGCTGARLVVTIMHEMKRSDLERGLVSLCIGGGQGMAMLVEKYH
ncbi:MAG: acetyl-CoA C-acetyltransferase [Candidatus Bathyarchaeota archaeon]|nr:MAG: acetyl-CoA C-acetyltransferase [Candidatus Bathyarchaeota archaeon]